MDWSKAKNILIMAFIVTNIFLAYVLFMTEEDEKEVIVKDDLIVDVVKLLDKENIKVDTEVPKVTPKLPVISLEYEVYRPEKILESFSGKYTLDSSKEEKTYVSGEKSIRLTDNNKRVTYVNLDLMNKPLREKISKQEALEKSNEFITSHGFDLKDAELSSYKESGGAYTFIYNKVLEGVVIEETNMTLEVTSEGVSFFERYWTRNIKKGNEILITSSAPKALLRLLNREEYYGKTIKKIDMCYYFNIDEYTQSISFNDSKGGLASPTWRFTFQDGEKAFLEEE